MLFAGTCDIWGDTEAWIARSRVVPLGAAIGTPPGRLLRDVLRSAPGEFELLVQDDDVGHARAALRDWRVHAATMHVRPPDAPAEAAPPASLDIRIADPPDAPSVYALPADWRLWATVSAAFATVWADGRPVAICEAIAVTETLWEVGVGTLDAYRRRGHARAAYLALTSVMRAKGKLPVWGSLDDNEASLRLAESLGFRAVERLWLLTPPLR